jgi:hypothetical protein
MNGISNGKSIQHSKFQKDVDSLLLTNVNYHKISRLLKHDYKINFDARTIKAYDINYFNHNLGIQNKIVQLKAKYAKEYCKQYQMSYWFWTEKDLILV